MRLQEETAHADIIKVSEDLLVDIAPDGTVYGSELLNANRQLCGSDEGALVNEALGKWRSVPLGE